MKKRFVAMALCLALSAFTTAAGASVCFPAYTGSSSSIAAALDALGADASYTNRVRIAQANGISGYRGTAAQNIQMLELLKRGALIDPSAPTAADSLFFPAYTGSSPSIVTALNTLDVDSSFSHRTQIAAANSITNYSGTAAQNSALLQLLKQGRLIKPDSSGTLLDRSLGKVSFLRQDKNTCKATSAAMAVNLILGRDQNTTADMIYSGVLCRSLEGEQYRGSDGATYRAVYKTDGYVGSWSELAGAVDTALSNGLPIVAAVHSAATRHHWVVIVGRDSSGGYLVVDPARSGSGSMASQSRSMDALGYSFGLTDYASPHYGYIAFYPVN